ncbi:MAG: hypothetical protein WDN06_20465 [Asticcacaulis sp.]
MAPNLMWNAQAHWITFAKQFGRIEASHFTLQYVIEFLLTQPLLLNPLVFAFVYIGAFAAIQTRDSRLRLLAALPLPLFAYLLVHVFHDRIQGNWPAPAYPGLVILAAVMAEGIGDGKLKRARDLAAPIGIAVTAVVLLVLAFGSALPGAAGLSNGWQNFAHDIRRHSDGAHGGWIATTDYDSDAELQYYGFYVFYGAVQPVAERERYAWLKADPRSAGTRALIVVAPNHQFDLSACFDDIHDEGIISRGKPGKKTDFHLYSGTLTSADCELK